MYESHFGLSGPPFQLNPDPAFYFNSRGHGHALAYLRYGVAQGEGFIVVTGEIGAGKTTLLRALLDELDDQRVVAAQIVSTQLESGDLLQAIVTAFGVPMQGNNKASLIGSLEAFLMQLAVESRRALLIIDEAQNLEIKSIEELRMLSNFQLGTQSLLQSFLVGQPELRKKLESPAMEQLRQRVTASCHLGPLGPEETRAYIEHRLHRVGWTDRPRFEPGAFDHIYRWSGGVPRRINRLSNRMLLAAFLEGRDSIDAALVEQTALDLRQEIGESSFEPLPLPDRSANDVAAPNVDPSPVAAVPSGSQPVQAQPNQPPVEPEASHPDAQVTEEGLFLAEIEPALVDVAPPAAETAEDERVAESEAPTAVESVQPDVVGSNRTLEPVASELNGQVPALPDVAGLGESMHPAEGPEHSAEESPSATQEPLDVVEEHAALMSALATCPTAVVRWMRSPQRDTEGTLLCVADEDGAALKVAAMAKALASRGAGAPLVVWVNPGVPEAVWPWADLDTQLPVPDVCLHLGVTTGHYESATPDVMLRFADVLDEFSPTCILTLGHSDAILTCALVAHKRGLPLLRAEAGHRAALPGRPDVNSTLIEQMSEVLLVSNGLEAHQCLYRHGIPALKVYGVPGRLCADVVDAVLPAMTTPYGAFLRHRLPIFLGPRWSSEVDGTAYAVVDMGLPATASVEEARSLLTTLVSVTAVPKLIWITDESTRAAIRSWQQTTPARADEVFIIEDPLPRVDLDRRNSAKVLVCDIRSLADRLTVLRGAVAVISQPGRILAEAASLLGIPGIDCLDGQVVASNGQPTPAASVQAFSAEALNDILASTVALGEPAVPATELGEPVVAAAAVAGRVAAWVTKQLAVVGAAASTGLATVPVATGVVLA